MFPLCFHFLSLFCKQNQEWFKLCLRKLRMTNLKNIVLSAVAIAAMTGCGETNITYGDSTVSINGDTSTTTTDGTTDTATDTTIDNASSLSTKTLAGNITTDTKLTADTLWLLDGLVVVTNGATLTIEPGTVIAGLEVDGDAASYMIIDKGAKIIADGTADKPIIFTSKSRVDYPSVKLPGQWGGLTIIGNAANSQVGPYEVNEAFVPGQGIDDDNSGILRHVKILNSGISAYTDKEINGLSMVGVGSGTVVEDITVEYSDDDGVEIWGGTVNLTNVTVSHCTDDHFDIDDGYSGTVKNLVVHATSEGYAGIEMSGDTYATFDGFTITVEDQVAEGGIFFKKSGVGGHFKNGTIIYKGNVGAIYSQDAADLNEISFENVGIYAADGKKFVNKTNDSTDSADDIEAIFASGTNGNDDTCSIPAITTLTGNLTGCTVLTSDKTWELDGLAVVTPDASFRIQEGTTIVGNPVDGDAASYMIVDKDAKIYALGTKDSPIVFTSKDQTVQQEGLWGGLTIIGNAANSQVGPYEVNEAFVPGQGIDDDNSGILKHVQILNSGISAFTDKEINGLSMVGVGSGTVVEDITVDYSDDDGVEIWGGTVNLTNVTVSHCTDDHFDIDDGYSGTVTNLVVNASAMGYAGIEMSGDTYATFDGFTITVEDQVGEGGIFFKKSGVGGHFKNGTINYNSTAAGAIYSQLDQELTEISFENVTINTAISYDFVNKSDATTDSADEIETIFNDGTGNVINYN